MIVEKVDLPFLKEESLKGYRKTLLEMSNFYFAPMACDQDSHEDRKRYYALKCGIELIDKELSAIKEEIARVKKQLEEKYGKYGIDKDWFWTMDGSVHLNDGKVRNV